MLSIAVVARFTIIRYIIKLLSIIIVYSRSWTCTWFMLYKFFFSFSSISINEKWKVLQSFSFCPCQMKRIVLQSSKIYLNPSSTIIFLFLSFFFSFSFNCIFIQLIACYIDVSITPPHSCTSSFVSTMKSFSFNDLLRVATGIWVYFHPRAWSRRATHFELYP